MIDNGRRIGKDCGVIVYKREHIFVNRIYFSTGTLVTGAEIALWIIGKAGWGSGLTYFALPWALGAMRRDHDP